MNRLPRLLVAGSSSLLICQLLLLDSARGQQAGPAIIETDATAFPQVKSVFEVRLPSGELADAIESGRIRVLEEDKVATGRLKPVGPGNGVAYAFAVDTSGTMKSVLDPLRAAVAGLVRGLGEKDRAALISFDDEARTLQAFTADKESFVGALQGLHVAGKSTQLYLGVLKAVESLSAPGLPPRKVVVVVSDGKDEGTAYTLDDVIGAASKSGVSVIGFGLTGGDARYILNLQRMAEQTGGLFVRAESGSDWALKAGLVTRHVASRFVYEWDSTLPADGRAHQVRLEVRGEAGSVGADLIVKTPDAPWWRRPVILMPAGVVAAVVLLAVFVVWRQRRRARREQQNLESELGREREQRAEVERKMGAGLEKVSEQLGELGKAAAAPPTPVAAAAVPVSKRRTQFMASSSAGSSYRSAQLEVLDGPFAGSRLPLPQGRTTLGRDETNQIVVPDEKASSSHAVIVGDGNAYRVEDLGSTNGTFVGDARLVAPWGLRDGDLIRLGQIRFRFRGEP